MCILDYLKPINMSCTSHMAYQIQHENLEASSITKVTIYKKEKRKKKKYLMAKIEQTVKKEGRQLSFTLFYYLKMS